MTRSLRLRAFIHGSDLRSDVGALATHNLNEVRIRSQRRDAAAGEAASFLTSKAFYEYLPQAARLSHVAMAFSRSSGPSGEAFVSHIRSVCNRGRKKWSQVSVYYPNESIVRPQAWPSLEL
jgi:hypothetical protein